ncbi:MAG: glycosyltransferase family 4 protein [Candidatus Eremiobacteraeota bacterium]|nr:glycosyltransferase family 4 protein [Candidatus Eremiobacteraeota bacterium]MBV8374997.1 glycosyltransferase family 4 protein [Candidatus Eremiobacteraeota bacterium]
MLPPRALFVGSYPPRECGIATFTKDVVDSYNRTFGVSSEVVAVDEPGGEMRRYGNEVIGRIAEQDRFSYADVARNVNRGPVEIVNIQHEYGLFGGERGEWLVDFMRTLDKPVVITLHTVLPEPDETMLRVTNELCAHAARVVALSETGRQLLEGVYGIDAEKLRAIPHGVPDVPFQSTDAAKASFGIGQRTVISTFGLISRGKGLEYAIEAMREVVKRHPEVLYLILGETHPVVRRQEGESYRESIASMVRDYGLQYNVQLIDRYLDFDELVGYLAATDIYLTPYLNPVQIVSGTLAYAVGCGKAIVSTPYLYAKELLAHNRGFLCEFRDAASIAAQLTMLLDDPALRRATERRAYRFGRRMTWPHVAVDYGNLFLELVPPESLELVSTA